MEYEQLEKLVLESKDYTELQYAFSSLTQSERKRLSAKTIKLKNQITRMSSNKDASERLQKYISEHGEEYSRYSRASNNAMIALLAVAPVSAVKKADVYFSWDEKEVIAQIILDRKPEWLDDWVTYDLEQEFSAITFSMVRKWISAGICLKPRVDGYFRQLAWNLMSTRDSVKQPHKPPLSEQLLAEPDLLEDVWGLFTIESQAFDDSSWVRRNAPENYESWSEALIKLSYKGVIDRDRLLNESLNGLLIDAKQNYLSGFYKFHKELNPSKEELKLRQDSYLSLLCHQVGHVVKFSLSMLKLIEKNGDLEHSKFLSEVPVVFQKDAKGTSIDSIRLIKTIIKKEPSLLGDGLYSLFEGLRHPNMDVQSMTLDVFDSYKDRLNEKTKAELLSSSSFVAASIKNRVLSLVSENESVSETSDQSLVIPIDKLISEFDVIKPETKVALGLTSLFDSDKFDYCSITPDIKIQKILHHQELLDPITGLDELILSVSHAVESVDSADEVERILDGISRLCGEKPKDFADRVAPLLHRVSSGSGLTNKNGIANFGGTRLIIADLLLSWLTGGNYESQNSDYFSVAESLIPTNNRLRNLIKRVVSKNAQPLIAAPTHSGGWIDPLVWVDRIVHFEDQGVKFDRIEFNLSLLRLAPDNRPEALERVKSLTADIFRVANFALGGVELPKYSDRKDYDIWISAARSRNPYKDWSKVFEPLKLNDTWADSLKPAIYDWHAYHKSHSNTYNFGQGDKTETWKTPHIDLDVKVGSDNSELQKSGNVLSRIRSGLKIKATTDSSLMPAAALNRRKEAKYSWSEDFNSVWLSDWLSYQWPLCPDAAYITGVQQLVSRIDMDGSNWEPCFGFLYGLFQRNRPWRDAGHLLVCIGLVGKDADARGLAIDALIAGIENGCVDIGILSKTLIKLSDGGWLKLNRLGDNLLQVSQVSILHSWVIFKLVQEWLLKVDIKQRYLFRMLEVLREAQFTIRQPLCSKIVEKLKEFKGSTKAAKIARELLQDTSDDNSSILEVKQLVLVGRLN